MRLDTHPKRDWGHTSCHFLVDLTFWFCSFAAATAIRFHGDFNVIMHRSMAYAPAVLIGGLAVASCFYVSGLYSLYAWHRSWRKRLGIVSICLIAGAMFLLALGSLAPDGRVGRGVGALGFPLAACLALTHHLVLHRRSRNFRENGACIITCWEDQVEALRLLALNQRTFRTLGCFTSPSVELHPLLTSLGSLENLDEGLEAHDISRIFCTQHNLRQEETARTLRRLRYSGMAISSVTEACEEIHQAIPLELIDHEWLLHACGQPGYYYVSKLKRLGDILIAFSLGTLVLPLVVLCWIAVRLTSRGPGFYSQVREGRFGVLFHVHKLRTMRVDAEANGPQWSQLSGDSRITPIGHYLRKFRIDELPQLWNVLIGEMSFVGPRPERPEFTKELASQIPFFRERLLIRPGLTGWAQVCYPYGASVDDARRKLEFDLYYVKHMSISLDTFVLLDTIKIIVLGGASERRGASLTEFQHVHRRVTEEVSELRQKTVRRLPDCAVLLPAMID
jgi:exopolysaccharide biosynthesis polyprenyl glycosylphosphotransferase